MVFFPHLTGLCRSFGGKGCIRPYVQSAATGQSPASNSSVSRSARAPQASEQAQTENRDNSVASHHLTGHSPLSSGQSCVWTAVAKNVSVETCVVQDSSYGTPACMGISMGTMV